ncbi:hypothetical protein, partial [Fulvimarina sp. MAC3]|uniref:hypothetical protein n=1 Tax=Fulvimarina sp. MAC3 TaxID=3148887 RepID=UPI0031FDD2CE
GKGTVQKARNRKNAAHVSLSSQYHITNLSKNTQSQKPRRTKAKDRKRPFTHPLEKKSFVPPDRSSGPNPGGRKHSADIETRHKSFKTQSAFPPIAAIPNPRNHRLEAWDQSELESSPAAPAPSMSGI